jgi:hypothetical protein
MYAVTPNPAYDGTDHGDPARPALHHSRATRVESVGEVRRNRFP